MIPRANKHMVNGEIYSNDPAFHGKVLSAIRR